VIATLFLTAHLNIVWVWPRQAVVRRREDIEHPKPTNKRKNDWN